MVAEPGKLVVHRKRIQTDVGFEVKKLAKLIVFVSGFGYAAPPAADRTSLSKLSPTVIKLVPSVEIWISCK